MGRILLGLWDCKYCDTKAIKGSRRECPNCGKVRDANTDFYLPKSKVYVPEDEAKKINKNPDWVCEYCGEQLNSDNDKFCKSCGAPREKEGSNYFEYREKKNLKEKKADSKEDSYDSTPEEKDPISYHDGTDSSEYKSDDYSRFSSSREDVSRRWQRRESARTSIYSDSKDKLNISINWKAVISVILCIAAVIGLVYLFIPKEKDVTILELGWERTISIEKYKTFDESGWTLPSGARLKYSQSEIHHYEQVIDHYVTKTRQVQKERLVGYEDYVVGTRDLGNGYFEEITSSRPVYETYYENEEYQEPVYKDVPRYQTKYYYEIDRWVYERSVKTAEMNQEPYWGDVILGDKEREGSRNEVYLAKVIDKKNKESTMYFDYTVWNEFKTDQVVKVKVDLFGNAKLSE